MPFPYRLLATVLWLWLVAEPRGTSPQDDPRPGGRRGAIESVREGNVVLRVEGRVLDPDGAVAEGALVTSSAGGRGIADDLGRFAFESVVPAAVEITAHVRWGGKATARPGVVSGLARAGTLRLAPGGACTPGWIPTFGELPGVKGNRPWSSSMMGAVGRRRILS